MNVLEEIESFNLDSNGYQKSFKNQAIPLPLIKPVINY